MLKDQAAAHYLADLACEVLFHYPGPVRWWELCHNVSAVSPADADVLMEVLAADARFVRRASRWDLAPRSSVGSRPLGGALDALLECYGKPMPRALLIGELCLSRPGSAPQHDELLTRLLTTSRDVAVFDGCVYSMAWLPRLGAADRAGLLFINDLTQDQPFLSLQAKLMAAAHKQRQVLDTAEMVLKTARVPLHNRALGVVLAGHHGSRFDPAAVLAEMSCDERFLCLSGPAWTLQSHVRTWEKAFAGSGGGEEQCEERPLDLAALLQTPAGQRLKLDASAHEALQMLASSARTMVDVAEGAREVLDIRPRQRQFHAAIHAVETAFAGNLALVRVRPGRYLPRQGVPGCATSVPEALVPAQTPLAPGYPGVQPVPMAELPPELAELVTNPSYEDVGETAVVPDGESLQEICLVIPWHHHRCGTMRVRPRDRRFFDLPAALTVLTLITPDDQLLPVWANGETRLLYGLLAWYDETLPVSGALLTLRRADASDTYVIAYEGEVDPAADIAEDRLAQLLRLRERLHHRPVTLAEAVTAVLQGHKRGLTFDHLWFEVNVVRRTTRHQLASALVLTERYKTDNHRNWRNA